MTPRATVALLNWNGGDFVRPCIESRPARSFMIGARLVGTR